MFKRFSNTRARAPCNPRRGAVFAPKWAKKFCKPALRQLAKFRVHSRSIAIKNRVIVSFFALSRLFALIRPTPSAFYHSSRKLTLAPHADLIPFAFHCTKKLPPCKALLNCFVHILPNSCAPSGLTVLLGQPFGVGLCYMV